MKPIEFNDGGSNDPLHALVRSLNQVEKAYVKKFSAHGGNRKDYVYMKLFDALAKEEEYDAESFKKKHAKAPFIHNLAANRSFLKETILNAMRNLHDKRDPLGEVFGLISDFHFLKEKGIYKEAKRRLKKAKDKAEKLEADWLSLEIVSLGINYDVELIRKGKPMGDAVRKNQVRQKELMDRIEREYLFMNSYYDIFVSVRAKKPRIDLEPIRNLLSSPWVSAALKGSSQFTFTNRLYILLLQALIARSEGDKKRYHLICYRVTSLFEKNNRTKGRFLKSYVKAAANYLESCHELGEYDDFDRIILRWEKDKVQTKGLDTKIEIEQNLLLYKQLLAMNTDEWEKARKITDEVRKLFREHGIKVNRSREIMLSYNCMVTWFFLEKLDEMRPWILYLLEKGSPRPDIGDHAVEAAKIMQIIYFIERKEDELAEYLGTRAKKKIKHRSQGTLIKKLRKITTKLKDYRKPLFADLAKFLDEQLNAATTKEVVAGYKEMYFWAKSRELGISIIEAHKRFKDGDPEC